MNAGGGTSASVLPSSASGVSVTPVSAVVTGLASNTVYYFRVSATNAAGGPVNGATQSFVTVPAAPTGVSSALTSVVGRVAVSWTAPSGAGVITGYTVTATSTDGGTTRTCSSSGAPAATTCDVSGLTLGATYTFTVTATNACGHVVRRRRRSGRCWWWVRRVRRRVLVAEPLQGSASVSFTAPMDAGGGTITDYEYSLNDGVSWVTLSPAATTSPVTMSGFDQWGDVSDCVACGERVWGRESSESTSVTIGVPTAPRRCGGESG